MSSLTMPIWKSSIQNHSSAAMTLGMRNGSRSSRAITVDCVSRCISTAIARASVVCSRC